MNSSESGKQKVLTTITITIVMSFCTYAIETLVGTDATPENVKKIAKISIFSDAH